MLNRGFKWSYSLFYLMLLSVLTVILEGFPNHYKER